MFRTQANPMDDAVVKATDENLTSENWAYILDVCDQVSTNSSGPQAAITALIKRLAHRNANVQLYTLELAHALSQNCGIELHRELASKAFTDALLRLAADRNSHAQVKQKVLERMGTWSEEFAAQPELGIMAGAYQKLRVAQPGLLPPSKPVKREISGDDRRKEEDELQMALALSVKDKGVPEGAAKSGGGGGEARAEVQSAAPTTQQGTTAATVSRVRALYDFTPSEAGELAFRKNDVIAVLESVYKDWWKGSLRGQTGIFPLNYVEKLQDPTKDELERDAQMEAEVFGEIKNVEKLLALLSVGGEGGGRRGEREEDEIGELYQRTLSIRPKLIELIARYSQKKDDFTQLNEKFIKARRDYEALLESSMAQPQYQQPPLQQYPIRPRQTAQQPSYPPQAPHQQPPYGGPQQPPPQSYHAQGTSSAQGYPPQPHFAQQSQQHLPPQQDPQRFYSPSPADQPPHQQPTFASPYQQHNAPPPGPVNNGGQAPFHFIPGGLPQQQQQQQGLPPQQQQHPADVRRKPSPLPGGDPYHHHNGLPPHFQGQGQLRPNSIHTLNSGNPQELATSGYESPTENRHSYPASGQMLGQQAQPPPSLLPAQGPNPGHEPYPPQQAQAQVPPPLQPQSQQQVRNDRDALPSRQRSGSFESPGSLYVGAGPGHDAGQGYDAGGGGAPPPPQPMGAPPGAPASPSGGGGAYQAYQPYSQGVSSSGGGGGGGGGAGDPGDYYR